VFEDPLIDTDALKFAGVVWATFGIERTFTFGDPAIVAVTEPLTLTVDPVTVPMLFPPAGVAPLSCTVKVGFIMVTLDTPTMEKLLLVTVTVPTLTETGGIDWIMTVETFTCLVFTGVDDPFVIVTLDPETVPMLKVLAPRTGLLVTATFGVPVTVIVATFTEVLFTFQAPFCCAFTVLLDPSMEAETRRFPGVPWTTVAFRLAAVGCAIITVDPVTLKLEFVIVTFPIVIVELAVVNRGFPDVPTSAPELSRRFTCCARYFVMRKAAVVVLATGGMLSP